MIVSYDRFKSDRVRLKTDSFKRRFGFNRLVSRHDINDFEGIVLVYKCDANIHLGGRDSFYKNEI